MKVVVNKCYGGFGLSEKAYEKLHEYGVPIRMYVPQTRGSDGLYDSPSENEGVVIFDRDLENPDPNDLAGQLSKSMRTLGGRYWDNWTRDRENRAHPLIVRVVEELGEAASGRHSELTVIEIPDDVQFEIDDYDGIESIHEVHRSW